MRTSNKTNSYIFKAKKVKIFLLLLNVVFIHSQIKDFDNITCSSYYENFNKAKLTFVKGSLDFDVLDSLIQKSLSTNNNPLSVDLFFALNVYAKHCKEERFLSISKKLLSNGVDKKIIFQDVPVCINKKNIKKSLENYNFYNNKNKEVISILNKIKKADEKSQSLLISNRRRELINTKNYNLLIDIINQIGKWPGISVTGQDLNIYHVDISHDFTQALLHFNTSQIESLLPHLFQAVQNKELSPYHFARIYDYYYIKKTANEGIKKILQDENINGEQKQLTDIISKQFFGIYKSKNKKEIYPPVINPNNLRQRREKICMLGEDLNLK